MKVKWRQNELILVTVLVITTAINYLVSFNKLSADYIKTAFSDFFEFRHIPFNYVENILLPQIGCVAAVYLFYLWINLLIIPKLINLKEKKSKTYLGFGLQLAIISFLFALSINIANYYARPYLGYSVSGFFSLLGYNNEPMANIFFGVGRAIFFVSLYSTYVAIREWIIFKIGISEPKRAYYTLVANRITTFVLFYAMIPSIVWGFQLLNNHDYFLYSLYFIFITPAVFVYLTDTYLLFPKQKKLSIDIKLIGQLILSTFICTTIFFGVFTDIRFYNSWWILSLIIQLLIVTPIAWFLYELRKDKWQQLIDIERELVKSKTDLQFLRSQINPHFLFNALNTIYGTAILESSPKTAEAAQKLGDMMRFMLHDNLLDFIPLKNEIAYLKDYIAMQRLRIQTSSDITIEEYIDEKNNNSLITPMILVPLVENAFKHGISFKEKSWIKVRLNYDREHINFEVINSTHSHKTNAPENERSGIGLKNLQERLLLFYKDKYQLSHGVTGKEFIAKLYLNLK